MFFLVLRNKGLEGEFEQLVFEVRAKEHETPPNIARYVKQY